MYVDMIYISSSHGLCIVYRPPLGTRPPASFVAYLPICRVAKRMDLGAELGVVSEQAPKQVIVRPDL